jgi:hypothetical protein
VYTANSPINAMDPTGYDDDIEYGGLVLFGLSIGGVAEAVSLFYANANFIIANYLPQLLSVNADQVLDLLSIGQSIYNWHKDYFGTSLQTRSGLGSGGGGGGGGDYDGGGGGNTDNPFGPLYEPDEGPDIALGMDKSDTNYPGLKIFARNKNAKWYEEWLENRLISANQTGFASEFKEAMLRTENAHFALDGLGWPDVNALKQSISQGAKGFIPENLTNAEIYQILNNRSWYNKTIFYYQGNVVQLPFGGP